MSAPRGHRSRGGGRGAGRKTTNSRNSSDTESTKASTRDPRLAASTRFLKPNEPKNGIRAEANAKAKTIPSKRGGLLVGNQQWRTTEQAGNAEYKERMHELWQQLKVSREKERKDAIRNGFLADPNKPTRLKDAITPRGTCQDMCTQYERVERIVQLMVDGCEKTTVTGSNTKVPNESCMVKRFRRSAAGYDEQLPSDIRPPLVLQKTLNYLIDEVVGGPEPLAKVHKFVWDRTRGIRNDFSIQQVTKVEDVKVAIDCFERIARFHLLSLHQLSHPDRDNGEFDHHQEREQLNNTLLSLMYYYEDNRKRFTSPNEAEFRACCIIFEIQDQRPDLEDRAQMWPMDLVLNPRVQAALRLHAAALDTTNEHGPLRPRAPFFTAQNVWGRFWSTVRSPNFSYLMACAAEIYFNLIRGNALEAILAAYKRAGRLANQEDMILKDWKYILGFDNEEQAKKYSEEHGLSAGISVRKEGPKGNRVKVTWRCIDLSTIRGKGLIDSNPRRKQLYSKFLVEKKRRGRTFRDVINGLTYSHCKKENLLVKDESCIDTGEEDELPLSIEPVEDDSDEESSGKVGNVPNTRLTNGIAKEVATAPNPFAQQGAKPSPFTQATSSRPNPFQVPSSTSGSSATASPSIFGQPASTASSNNPFQKATITAPSSILGVPKASSPFQKPPVSNTEIANKLFSSPPNQTQNTGFATTTTPPTESAGSGQKAQASPYKLPGSNTPFSPFSTSPKPSGSNNENANKLFGTKSGQPEKSTSTLSQPGPSIFDKPASTSPGSPPLFVSDESPSSNIGSTSAFPSSFNVPPVSSTEQDQKRDGSSTSTGFAATESPASIFQFGTPQNAASNLRPLTTPQAPSTPTLFQFPPSNTPSTTFTATPPLPTTFETRNTTSFPTQSPDTNNLPTTQKPLPSFTSSQQQKHNPSSVPSLTTGSQPSATPSLIATSSSPTPSADKPPHVPQPTPQITISEPPSLAKNPLQHILRDSTSPPRSFSSSTTSSSSVANDSSISRGTKQRSEVRRKALDELSKEVVCGEYGLLQLIVEHVAAPIVRKALRKVARERESQRVANARSVLLSIKYFRKWKNNAWKLNLARRGRERRKHLAQSMRSLAESARNSRSPSVTSSQEVTEVNPLASLLAAPNRTLMPPPTKTIPNNYQQKKSSLAINGKSRNRAASLQSRHHIISTISASKQNSPSFHHKRSQTLGGSLNTTQSGRIAKHSASTNGASHRFVGADEFMSDSLMQQARLLISGRTDKTRTDYFRLKAMGVDPDTPLIPHTRKRSRNLEPSDHESSKSPRISPNQTSPPPHHQSLLSNNSTTNSGAVQSIPKYEADEEELFAQVRKVREAMAEGEVWFRQEREKEEKQRASAEPKAAETEKERRLREFQFTPSRTSLRLQRTNASGLLPEGWAEKKSLGRGKEVDMEVDGEEENTKGDGTPRFGQAGPPRAMGFAAFANNGNNAGGSKGGFAGGRQNAFQPIASSNGFGLGAAGSSVEDAIEL